MTCIVSSVDAVAGIHTWAVSIVIIVAATANHNEAEDGEGREGRVARITHAPMIPELGSGKVRAKLGVSRGRGPAKRTLSPGPSHPPIKERVVHDGPRGFDQPVLSRWIDSVGQQHDHDVSCRVHPHGGAGEAEVPESVRAAAVTSTATVVALAIEPAAKGAVAPFANQRLEFVRAEPIPSLASACIQHGCSQSGYVPGGAEESRVRARAILGHRPCVLVVHKTTHHPHLARGCAR